MKTTLKIFFYFTLNISFPTVAQIWRLCPETSPQKACKVLQGKSDILVLLLNDQFYVLSSNNEDLPPNPQLVHPHKS